MKTTSIIIATVLSLQVSVLFAGNNETRSTVSNEAVSFNNNFLAPVTPTEATFEDAICAISFTFDHMTLAPETPVEADFSDILPEKNIDLTILAPVVPAEADFNDSIEDRTVDLSALMPVTPAEADFSDIL